MDPPCIDKFRHGETCCKSDCNFRRSRYACIVEANESTRMRIGKRVITSDHEDLVAQTDTHTLCHENSECKRLWLTRDQIDKLPAWRATKVNSKTAVIQGTKRRKNSPLCYIDGHLSTLTWTHNWRSDNKWQDDCWKSTNGGKADEQFSTRFWTQISNTDDSVEDSKGKHSSS